MTDAKTGAAPRQRLLVVEDNYLTAEVICDLARSNGFEVAHAVGTLDRALALAESEPIDGAVLDINLHGVPSFPVCRALHKRNIPFLFVTAYPDTAVGEHAWRPRTLLSKPVDPASFSAALGELVDGSEYRDNLLLSGLPSAELARLRPHLQPAMLRPGVALETAGVVPEHAVFPTSGLVSVQTGSRATRIEVAMVGREGLTGAGALVGARHSMHDSVVDVGGAGFRIVTPVLRELLTECPVLRERMEQHVRGMLEQVGQSALLNAQGTIEERLARRLLQSSERLGTLHLVVTHDELAARLGARRPSVTLALQTLEGRGVLRSRRRSIEILDRDAMTALLNRFDTPRRRFDA